MGIKSILFVVEAPLKTEVLTGLHTAHCEHADFSDYTFIDLGKQQPNKSEFDGKMTDK